MLQWDESPKTGGAVDQSSLTSTATGLAIPKIHHNEEVMLWYPSKFLFVEGVIVFLM